MGARGGFAGLEAIYHSKHPGPTHYLPPLIMSSTAIPTTVDWVNDVCVSVLLSGKCFPSPAFSQ